MNERYHALLARDFERGPFFDIVRLYVMREVPGVRREYLRADGLWQSVDDATQHDSETGLALPVEAIEAIATAIEQFQGHTNHADTEARVLREWLAVERSRVDEVLAKTRPSDAAA